MKILLWILMFVSVSSFGQLVPPKAVEVLPTGGSPIPASYSSGATSRVITGLGGHKHISIINNTDCGLIFNTTYDSTTPPDGSVYNMRVPEGALSLGQTFDELYIAGSLYIRSNCDPSGPITAGRVIINIW